MYPEERETTSLNIRRFMKNFHRDVTSLYFIITYILNKFTNKVRQSFLQKVSKISAALPFIQVD